MEWFNMNSVHDTFENSSFMDRHTSWTIQHLGFIKNVETKFCLMQKKAIMCSLKLNTKITLNGTEFHHGKLSLQSRNDGLKQGMITAIDE
jgi:hypothetical protein